MPALTYRIAGLVLQTDSDVTFSAQHLSYFEPFRIGDAAPDVCFRFRRLDPESLTLAPLSGEEEEHLSRRLYCPYGGWESPLVRSPLVRSRFQECVGRAGWVSLVLRGSFAAITDCDRRELEYYYTPNLEESLTYGCLPASMLAPFLPPFGAAMLHSLGLVRHGRAALFLALDGGGKSTVAVNVLAARAGVEAVLSDDQVVLRREGDGLTAYGTPWGLVSSLQSAPAAGLFVLEKSERFALARLEPRAVFEQLWSDYLGSWEYFPKQVRALAFDIVARASRQLPAYRMSFAPDRIDWDAIDAAMESR